MPADIPPPSREEASKALIELSRFAENRPSKPRGQEQEAAVTVLERYINAAEAENERLRGLRDRAEVAFKELEEAERRLDRLAEAVKDNDQLRAELAEAVALMSRLRECKCLKPGCVYHDAAAFVAKHKGNA